MTNGSYGKYRERKHIDITGKSYGLCQTLSEKQVHLRRSSTRIAPNCRNRPIIVGKLAGSEEGNGKSHAALTRTPNKRNPILRRPSFRLLSCPSYRYAPKVRRGEITPLVNASHAHIRSGFVDFRAKFAYFKPLACSTVAKTLCTVAVEHFNPRANRQNTAMKHKRGGRRISSGASLNRLGTR